MHAHVKSSARTPRSLAHPHQKENRKCIRRGAAAESFVICRLFWGKLASYKVMETFRYSGISGN
jgi:hypothetical protein